MGKQIYVGNLNYTIGNNELEKLFSTHGNVVSAKIVTDRGCGQSRGFGFVEMGTDKEAKEAISALNGKKVDGRPLAVSEAHPKEGGGHGHGGYGGSGGGRRGSPAGIRVKLPVK